MPRILMILLALVVGLVGLFLSACGGMVFFDSLGQWSNGGGSLLLLALVATLVGVGLCWLAFRWLSRPSGDAARPGTDRDRSP